jgi:hypothetical protein
MELAQVSVVLSAQCQSFSVLESIRDDHSLIVDTIICRAHCYPSFIISLIYICYSHSQIISSTNYANISESSADFSGVTLEHINILLLRILEVMQIVFIL